MANKRSIAWAIAQATASRGARVALTYQGRFEEHVNELSAELGNDPLVLPCDVTSDDDIASVVARVEQEFGGLDFLVHGAAFARKEELSLPFSETSREGFRIALDISAYSLIALSRGVIPLMEKRGGGSIVTLSYLGSDRVFPNYNVMGVAKAALESSVRYLAADLGPKNIRVNAVSAGPIKTLSAMGISGFSSILNVYRERAPLRRTVETSEVGEAAAFLLSDAGRGITGEVLDAIAEGREQGFEKILVGYADCGTGGELDRALAPLGIERLPGAHCYEFYAGTPRFAALHDDQPGTQQGFEKLQQVGGDVPRRCRVARHTAAFQFGDAERLFEFAPDGRGDRIHGHHLDPHLDER